MRWMWIDRIVELRKAERAVAVKCVSLAEEHLHDHFAKTDRHAAIPVMPASLIIEGMAQTAGILVGHARDFKEKVILAKVGKAIFDADVFPGPTLIYTATLDRIDDSGASTTGTVTMTTPHADAEARPRAEASGREASGIHVATIELMFSHIDQNRRGLPFPEHNFVFTDQFYDLLRNSGIDVER